jgi:hypothetical protein
MKLGVRLLIKPICKMLSFLEQERIVRETDVEKSTKRQTAFHSTLKRDQAAALPIFLVLYC